MKKKVVSLVMAACMTAGVLAGCGNSAAKEASIDKLTFTYVTSPLNVPSIIEKEKGIFTDTFVTDGKRTFNWPCIIRAINTTDVMEVTVEHLSDELIDHLVQRIITEVPGINRVLYDFTPKPPATVEYE